MGLLTRAARQGIVDLADAFERLKRTNFRYRQEIMDAMLNEALGKSYDGSWDSVILVVEFWRKGCPDDRIDAALDSAHSWQP